jgi:hypothetical protein
MKPEFNPAPGEEWRQSLTQSRIYEPFDAAFADACQRTQRNRQKIERKGQWLTMKVAAGDHIAFCVPRIGYEDERIIDGGVRFCFKYFTAMGKRVPHCTVYLWNAAQRVCVLHAAAGAVRFANLAAFEHATQVGSSFDLPAVWARIMNALVEGCVSSFQSVAAKATKHIRGIDKRFCC